MGFARLVLGAVGAGLLAGCSLGIDEDQIQSAGGAASTSSSQTSAGPGGMTASTTSATSAQSGATTAGTSSASTTATSTSTGMALPQVVCTNDQGTGLVDCAPGEVCCIKRTGNDGECRNDCGAGEDQYECDGPEDCPGQVCCAPDEGAGDVQCADNCADDNIVCKSMADCADFCGEPFPGVLGAAYQTCF